MVIFHDVHAHNNVLNLMLGCATCKHPIASMATFGRRRGGRLIDDHVPARAKGPVQNIRGAIANQLLYRLRHSLMRSSFDAGYIETYISWNKT
jgi:hypothetical protein